MKQVWDKKLNATGKPMMYRTDAEVQTAGIARVRSDNFVIFTTTESAEWYGPIYCDIAYAKTGLITRYRGMLARKGFPFMQEFNRELVFVY